jgi:hypothetical protein
MSSCLICIEPCTEDIAPILNCRCKKLDCHLDCFKEYAQRHNVRQCIVCSDILIDHHDSHLIVGNKRIDLTLDTMEIKIGGRTTRKRARTRKAVVNAVGKCKNLTLNRTSKLFGVTLYSSTIVGTSPALQKYVDAYADPDSAPHDSLVATSKNGLEFNMSVLYAFKKNVTTALGEI